MAVTHTVAISREQCFQQIDKLIKSHSLRTSESLCKLLRYLAEHSLDHPGVALKEYQIATEVLGRSAGFDPQSDSTVRVQAGRLRVKLAEYYAHEGTEDLIVVEIPKGSYALTFHVRPSKAGVQPAISLIADAGEREKSRVVRFADGRSPFLFFRFCWQRRFRRSSACCGSGRARQWPPAKRCRRHIRFSGVPSSPARSSRGSSSAMGALWEGLRPE